MRPKRLALPLLIGLTLPALAADYTTLEATSWTDVTTHEPGDSTPTISYTFTPGTPPAEFARLKVVQSP